MEEGGWGVGNGRKSRAKKLVVLSLDAFDTLALTEYPSRSMRHRIAFYLLLTTTSVLSLRDGPTLSINTLWASTGSSAILPSNHQSRPSRFFRDGVRSILKQKKNSISNLIPNTLLIVPFQSARALVQYPKHKSIRNPTPSKYPEHKSMKNNEHQARTICTVLYCKIV